VTRRSRQDLVRGLVGADIGGSGSNSRSGVVGRPGRGRVRGRRVQLHSCCCTLVGSGCLRCAQGRSRACVGSEACSSSAGGVGRARSLLSGMRGLTTVLPRVRGVDYLAATSAIHRPGHALTTAGNRGRDHRPLDRAGAHTVRPFADRRGARTVKSTARAASLLPTRRETLPGAGTQTPNAPETAHAAATGLTTSLQALRAKQEAAVSLARRSQTERRQQLLRAGTAAEERTRDRLRVG